MFHKAILLQFGDGTSLEVTFSTGEVKKYDISKLFPKYPQLEALKNRELFLSGKLMGSYGIMWNDELDLEVETVYEDGITVRQEKAPQNIEIGEAILKARALAGISQAELSEKSGIDQSDISKIERGISNPSVNTLSRIADAMNMRLSLTMQ